MPGKLQLKKVKEAAEEDEDGVKDLVDMILKKLDEDRDGRVSESDWAGAIAKESLLIEAFGKCLPTAKVIENRLTSGNIKLFELGSSGSEQD